MVANKESAQDAKTVAQMLKVMRMVSGSYIGRHIVLGVNMTRLIVVIATK